MKFTTSKPVLASTIGTVQKVVSTRSPLPILSGILLELYGNSLTVTGSDMELTIQCTANVEMEEEGSIVLPIKYIADLVRHLPDVPIKFHTLRESTSTTITYGTSQLNIHGFPPEQYPRLPAIENGLKFSLSQTLLKDMLRQVLFAVSNDETRPIFTGVLLQIDQNVMRMVATDTCRLAVRSLPLERELEQKINIIIPGKTLNEVARLTGGGEEEKEITIICGENHVYFLSETVKISSRLIAGQYPPYEQVIPREYITRARLVTREVLEATERASLLVRDGHPVIQFSLYENTCVVSVQAQAGWIREEITCEIEGEPVEIWFNARYMSDSLRALGSEELWLELTGPLSAAVLRPPHEDNYLSLLLPSKPPKG
ncbi:DNA polymerase III subunit beta [Desulfofundulus sp.]|uniref:DNA polymerase III subunit beta n=1 Tax=Desulfofundulus sp. TaxID=2282750 RepID=UPI003C7790D3